MRFQESCADVRVVNKCLYSVLGINMDGHKEILGMWISDFFVCPHDAEWFKDAFAVT